MIKERKSQLELEDGKIDQMPVVARLEDFDTQSGSWIERIIFNNRMVVLIIALLLTVVLGYQATKLVFNAGFEKMLPVNHPYIKNYLANQSELKGLGNTVRIAVENTKGDIFDPEFLNLFAKINDAVYLTEGVDRALMRSIWMADVRWTAITEEGFDGGPVMPDNYDGSVTSIEKLKLNIARSGIVGTLVSDKFGAAMIQAPLIDIDHTTGKKLDYSKFSQNLEDIRAKYEAEGKGRIKIHIVGFAKVVGELIAGLKQMMVFFGMAVLISALAIFIYSGCIRSTVLLVVCSLLAVIWQLGLVSTLGFELDPYAVLVPFLVFALSISHGMQRMNGILQDVGRGTHKVVAARYTFRRLFTAGLTGLMTNIFAFGLLLLIDIPVIRDLALAASVGVTTLIFTKLILTPVLLSYSGVSQSAARRSVASEIQGANTVKMDPIERFLTFFDPFTRTRWAVGALIALVIIAVPGFIISQHIQVGDLDQGAPELRPESRYNRDNDFINKNFGLSSDTYAVIVKTPYQGCLKYETLVEANRLAIQLNEVEGVQLTRSLAGAMTAAIAGTYEGSPKWYNISRNQDVLNSAATSAYKNDADLFNGDASVMPVIAYLSDHKAKTLERVTAVTEAFVKEHNTDKDRLFILAAGTAGIEAATNVVVEKSNRIMMIFVYAMVILFCFITFRNWRAVLIALIPLVVTSIICEVLMVVMGIGIKVATLPVIALGVGVGIDYALYLMSVQLSNMRIGLSLTESYSKALRFTGKVVALIGITMAGAVITWAWSPIKFQADMGILLAFMFFYNMIGALIFIPALSRFILGKSDEKGDVYLSKRERGEN